MKSFIIAVLVIIVAGVGYLYVQPYTIEEIDFRDFKQDCGSINLDVITSLNIHNDRTVADTKILECISDVILKCTPATFAIEHSVPAYVPDAALRPTMYRVEGAMSDNCAVSKSNDIAKSSAVPQENVPFTTCQMPMNYFSTASAKFAKFKDPEDLFLAEFLGTIDSNGMITDGFTNKTRQEFICN